MPRPALRVGFPPSHSSSLPWTWLFPLEPDFGRVLFCPSYGINVQLRSIVARRGGDRSVRQAECAPARGGRRDRPRPGAGHRASARRQEAAQPRVRRFLCKQVDGAAEKPPRQRQRYHRQFRLSRLDPRQPAGERSLRPHRPRAAGNRSADLVVRVQASHPGAGAARSTGWTRSGSDPASWPTCWRPCRPSRSCASRRRCRPGTMPSRSASSRPSRRSRAPTSSVIGSPSEKAVRNGLSFSRSGRP